VTAIFVIKKNLPPDTIIIKETETSASFFDAAQHLPEALHPEIILPP
jgi:hypothetical protein